MPASLVNKAL